MPRKGEKDEIWDIIVELWFSSLLNDTDRTRIGRLSRLFKQKQVTPQEIKRRKMEAEYEWPGLGEVVPETVLKHWDRWRKKPPRRTWPG